MSDQPSEQQRILDRLADHYANDRLELEEYERRVDLAQRATTDEELRELLADLEPRRNLPVPVSTTTDLATVEEVPATRHLVSVLGNVSRSHVWTVPRRLNVTCILGGADLDFRQARIGPGCTELRVYSVMGGVHIVVPEGLHVEVDGMAILGDFEDQRDVSEKTDEAPSSLRVTGVSFLGGVEVEARLPGESKRQARKRRKLIKRGKRPRRLN